MALTDAGKLLQGEWSAMLERGDQAVVRARAVQDAGFQYFDWNVDSNDAGGAKKAQTVFNNVTAGVSQNRVSVVLQHDIHDFSVDAVEDIIVWGLNNGYSFERLTENSPGVHHGVQN